MNSSAVCVRSCGQANGATAAWTDGFARRSGRRSSGSGSRGSRGRGCCTGTNVPHLVGVTSEALPHLYDIPAGQAPISQIQTFIMTSPDDGVTRGSELLVGASGGASGYLHLDTVGCGSTVDVEAFAEDLPGVAGASPGLRSRSITVLDRNCSAVSV